MKNYLLLFTAITMTTTAMAQHEVNCPFTSINNNIIVNTTLSSGTVYRLEGCIHVTNGVTLTIPAGTKLLGQKSSAAGLVIDKGGILIAQGTAASPIIITSDQQPGFRAAGDFSGLQINGRATNNIPGGTFATNDRPCDVNSGGSNDTDNSGTLKYIRLEYARYGFTFASVGSRTIVENLQSSYSAYNSYEFFGGTVRARRLISLAPKANDFIYKYGNRSLVQTALAIRLNSSASSGTAPFSNSILMANNDDAAGNYAATPATHPVISNLSAIGPLYCGATGISSNFKNAVLYQHNTEGGVYNSMIAGWPVGFMMEDAATLNNANVNFTLNFSENSFYNNTSAYAYTGTWPAGCAVNFTSWISGSSPAICQQPNNQFTVSAPGYNSTVCSNYCSVPPSWLMGNNDLSVPAYDAPDLNHPFFIAAGSRGAFDKTTDWTLDWAKFCPQDNAYCTSRRDANPTGVQQLSNAGDDAVQVIPNPANGSSYAAFLMAQAGNVRITLLNSIGQVVRSGMYTVEKGAQKIALHTEGLSTGIYLVNVQPANGQALQARLMIR